MDLTYWLPDFSAWTAADWSAAGTVATAIIASVAALVAFHQVREARKLREEQAQPFVVVDFELSPVSGNIINLVVENVGKTLARDVKLAFTPRLESTQVSGDYDLKNTTLLKDGIPTMPPGKRIVALFDVSHQRFSSGLPLSYTVKVEFRDSRRRKQEPLEYVLDLSFYYGLMSVNEYGLHHAAKALREIESTLKKWTAHINGLRVWVRDEDDYLERMSEEFEARRKKSAEENDAQHKRSDER